ncbi:MAG: hypothetical protein LBB79_10445 [Prevotellaceae bacterium]|jgi:hypothetical protein|nr:hypothetical protein [Prevotellaceae bacterium]
MDIFAQLLIASLSCGLLLFGAVYMVLRKMLAAESHRRNVQLLSTAKEITLPLRLQAHERLLVLLERISPEALVLRLRRPDTSNAELHSDLIAAVRSEFEHNLSQQMYVSPELWSVIAMAKNSVLSCINTCASPLTPGESSLQLAQKLLEWHVDNELPTAAAIQQLKKEVAKMF